MMLHVKYLNSARHIVNDDYMVVIFIDFATRRVCSSVLFLFSSEL